MRCMVVAFLSLLATGTRTALAQDSTSGMVEDALLAQTTGVGGCFGSIERTEQVEEPALPGVRVIRGECTLEHGDTAAAFVAVDSAGVVYVLGSPSAFQYLLRRHPARGLDSSSVLGYAQRAGWYTGSLPTWVTLVPHAEQLPDSILRRTRTKRRGLRVPGVERRSGAGFVVALLGYGPEVIVTRRYHVLPTGGIVELDSDDRFVPSK